MAAFKIINGKFATTCGGQFIICDDTSETVVCCYFCDNAGNTSYYNIVKPCNNIIATFSDVANDSCTECTNWNTSYELIKGNTVCADWSIVALDPGPCLGETAFNIIIGSHIAVCCTTDDKIQVWMYLEVSYDFSRAARWAKMLDEQDIVDGQCYYYDFGDPSDTLTYVTDGANTPPCISNADYFRSDCDFSASSVLIEAS